VIAESTNVLMEVCVYLPVLPQTSHGHWSIDNSEGTGKNGNYVILEQRHGMGSRDRGEFLNTTLISTPADGLSLPTALDPEVMVVFLNLNPRTLQMLPDRAQMLGNAFGVHEIWVGQKD
jgi:hypothetical protein